MLACVNNKVIKNLENEVDIKVIIRIKCYLNNEILTTTYTYYMKKMHIRHRKVTTTNRFIFTYKTLKHVEVMDHLTTHLLLDYFVVKLLFKLIIYF